MRPSLVTVGVACALILATAISGDARAQTDADRENAQALYRAGNDARDAGDMKTAAAKYKVAYALVQTPVIAVALGKAELATGQLIEARQSFLNVDRIPTRPNESTLTTTARAEASALASQVEPRIPTVTLKVKSPLGAPLPEVAIDGVMVPQLALDAPRKVDPGAHLAVATRGDAHVTTSFSVAEGETRAVPIDAPPLSAATPGPTGTPGAPPDAAPLATPSHTPAYVAFGVSGAGVLMTVIFGALAVSDKSTLDGACGASKTSCPSADQSTITGLRTTSIVSDVGLGLAIAGAAVGGVLLFTERGGGSAASTDKPTALRVEPFIGVGAFGVRGAF